MLERKMADRDAAGKLGIYHTIYCLNLSFANIVANCRALGESGILSPKFTRLYQSYAQELQAEINEDVMSAMDEVESRDQFRFGKARLAREKELRDPDDVFVHAEERRRELAKQGKKPPALKRSKTLRSQSGTARK
jgi:L-2-hydroxyglutarate oxidase LhgO